MTEADTTDARGLRVVEAWHGALNAGDVGRLVSLSHPEVEMAGPRGSVRGREVLRDWVGRANITLEPGRRFGRGRIVVVEEAATWRDAGSGEKTGGATVATIFTLEDGLVASIARHDDLDSALTEAGLDAEDEIRPG